MWKTDTQLLEGRDTVPSVWSEQPRRRTLSQKRDDLRQRKETQLRISPELCDCIWKISHGLICTFLSSSTWTTKRTLSALQSFSLRNAVKKLKSKNMKCFYFVSARRSLEKISKNFDRKKVARNENKIRPNFSSRLPKTALNQSHFPTIHIIHISLKNS